MNFFFTFYTLLLFTFYTTYGHLLEGILNGGAPTSVRLRLYGIFLLECPKGAKRDMSRWRPLYRARTNSKYIHYSSKQREIDFNKRKVCVSWLGLRRRPSDTVFPRENIQLLFANDRIIFLKFDL